MSRAARPLIRALEPEVTTPPAAALLTLAEAKFQLRISHDDEDTLISRLIDVVTARLDGPTGILGQCLINQTITWRLSDFPALDRLALPVGPVRSLTQISYYDRENILQNYATSNLLALNSRADGAYLQLGYTSSWPSNYDRDDAVSVVYVAGFGAAASAVPAPIRHAALMLLGHYYENRESVVMGGAPVRVPDAVDSLLAPYMRTRCGSEFYEID